MAKQIKTALPPELDLGGNWIIEWDAIDPATGATVPGVVVEETSLIVGGGLGQVVGGGGTPGPYRLVPGPLA